MKVGQAVQACPFNNMSIFEAIALPCRGLLHLQLFQRRRLVHAMGYMIYEEDMSVNVC